MQPAAMKAMTIYFVSEQTTEPNHRSGTALDVAEHTHIHGESSLVATSL